MVLAPRSTSTRAAGGFAAGNITDIFACMSGCNTPAARAAPNVASTPMSAIRTLRNPCSAARLASSSPATTCSWPRAAGASTAPAARGQEQVVAGLDDARRAAEHGFRSVLIADIGVLATFGAARAAGVLQPDMQAKISVMLPAANPPAARVLV